MGDIDLGCVRHPLANNLETTTPGLMAMDAAAAALIKELVESVETNMGDLATLETTDKDSLVSAINNLATAINSLNNKTFTSPEYTIDAGVTAVAKNGIVFIYSSSTTRGLTANTWNVIGTLSPALAPSREIQFTLSNMGGWVDMIGSVLADGKIRIFPKSDTSYWNFVVSYPYNG